MPPNPDPIRELCQTQARRLGLSAYALAKQSGVSEQHTRDFLTGRKDITHQKLAAIMAVLGLEVTQKGK